MMSDVDFEARVRFRRGMDVQALVREMAADGMDAAEAEAAVLAVQARLTAQDRRRGRANVGFGIVLAMVGLAGTLWAMVNLGGVFLIALGGLVIGAWLIGIGADQIAKAGTDSALARKGLQI